MWDGNLEWKHELRYIPFHPILFLTIKLATLNQKFYLAQTRIGYLLKDSSFFVNKLHINFIHVPKRNLYTRSKSRTISSCTNSHQTTISLLRTPTKAGRMNLKLFIRLYIICIAVPARSYSRPTELNEGRNVGKASRLLAGIIDPIGPGFVSVLTWMGLGPRFPPTQIKVNVVGLGRTGTTSLAVAMEILGFRVVHDEENPRLYDVYRDFYTGNYDEDELHRLIGERGYNATFKSNTYQWAGQQEDVKVVLTTRSNVEKWVTSWISVAYLGDLLERPPFAWIPSARGLVALRHDLFRVTPTNGHPEGYLDPKVLKKGYYAHIENVRRAVPRHRLLEYDVKQGWEPLCQFLNVPIPNVAFPHVNDKAKVRGMMLCYEMITWVFMPWPIYLLSILFWIWKKLFRREKSKAH